MNNKGFTLLEVLLAIVIAVLIISFVAQAIIVTNYSRLDLFYKMQADNLVNKKLIYYKNLDSKPYAIQDNNIISEFHNDLNYNANTTILKTSFAPIEINSVIAYYKHEDDWVSLNPQNVYKSGIIEFSGIYESIQISYSVTSWNYISDIIYNFNNFYLSYNGAVIDCASTNTQNIPLSSITLYDNGIININGYENEKIYIYYETKKEYEVKLIKPDLRNYNINENSIVFANSENIDGHYVDVEYFDSNNLRYREIQQIQNEQIYLKKNPQTISYVYCPTIQGEAKWSFAGQNDKYRFLNRIIYGGE